MDIDEIRRFEQQQRAKLELSLLALNQVAELDNALLEAQHKALLPKQVVDASRKRKKDESFMQTVNRGNLWIM